MASTRTGAAITIVVPLFITLATAVASAAPSEWVSFQGLLTDDNGAPLPDGSYQLTINFWDLPWDGTNHQTLIEDADVVDGLFNVELYTLGIDFDRPYYLGIQVDGAPELSPRVVLTSAPSARLAATVSDYAITAPKIANNAVTAPKINPAAVSGSHIASGSVVRSINGNTDTINLVAGNNVTITPSGNDFIFNATAQGGADSDWTVSGNNLYSGVSGNVGIGTTSPQEILHLWNANDPTVLLQSNGINEVSGKVAMRQSNWSGADIYYDGTGGIEGLAFETFSGVNSLGVQMFLQSDGDLGIGTTSPEAALHIVGGSDTGPASGGFLVMGESTGLNVSLDTNEIMARNNGTTARLFLQAEGGGLSVGTQSTSSDVSIGGEVRIDVGSSDNADFHFLNYNGALATLQPTIDGEGALGWNNYWSEIHGVIYFGTVYLISSDRSIKEDIRTFDGALDTVKQLRGTRYAFTRDYYDSKHPRGGSEQERTNQVGLIAQEVEQVAPWAVKTDESSGLKGVNYTSMVPVLIEAIKEQQTIIEELEARIASLERRN